MRDEHGRLVITDPDDLSREIKWINNRDGDPFTPMGIELSILGARTQSDFSYAIHTGILDHEDWQVNTLQDLLTRIIDMFGHRMHIEDPTDADTFGQFKITATAVGEDGQCSYQLITFRMEIGKEFYRMRASMPDLLARRLFASW